MPKLDTNEDILSKKKPRIHKILKLKFPKTLPVNDPFAMQKVQGQRNLGGVESGVLLQQPPLTLHVEHEIAPAHEFDDEEQSGGRLEARMQTDEERMIGGRFEDVLLRLHPIDVFVVGDQRLFDHLHGVDALRLLQFDHQHFGVGTATDHTDQIEIVEGVLALRRTTAQIVRLPTGILHRDRFTCDLEKKRSFMLSLY